MNEITVNGNNYPVILCLQYGEQEEQLRNAIEKGNVDWNEILEALKLEEQRPREKTTISRWSPLQKFLNIYADTIIEYVSIDTLAAAAKETGYGDFIRSLATYNKHEENNGFDLPGFDFEDDLDEGSKHL